MDFFTKIHESKVKIYNLCDDTFINTEKINFKGDIRVSYFPMMDHNPGSVTTLFQFTLDACLYLASEPYGLIAVHCKAGKGRTGFAICAYMLFLEAFSDAYEAIDFFNKRRTINGKGCLNVAS